MKVLKAFIFFFLILISCSSDKDINDNQSNSINKIMPLGASRVEGNRPLFESYRYNLWRKLKENNWVFDFIGTQKDEGVYNELNGIPFDIDHEGRGGWTSGQIANNLSEWLLLTAVPDIVLFSSPGGNDALQNLPYNEVLININSIIDTLQNLNPNITIVIEKLAPAKSSIMTNELTNYLEQLHTDITIIALEKTTEFSKVITVDMYTGFSDNLLADDVHYNEEGAEFIANKYYDKIEELLLY